MNEENKEIFWKVKYIFLMIKLNFKTKNNDYKKWNNFAFVNHFVFQKMQSIFEIDQITYMQAPKNNKPGVKTSSIPKNGATLIKKEEIKQKTGFTQFPTAKLANIKTADPFAQKKGNSFGHLYSSGAIPVKIEHGTAQMRLKWNQDVTISKLPYNPLLVTCFDGLIQQKHPYGFIAYNVSKQMIEDESSPEKLIEILNKLVWPLRTCLSSSNEDICQKGLEILRLLSDKVGSHLNSHVKNLVTPIKKHMGSKKLKEKALNVLRILEDNGGPEVGKAIKGAIPTYSNS